MQFEYVFADLQVQVTFVADDKSPFAVLTDNEVKAFQQLIYMTLTAFHYTRALYLADAVATLERIKQAAPQDKDRQKGG